MAVLFFFLDQICPKWIKFDKIRFLASPSAIDSEAIEPLSVLHSKLKFEW